jgi:hydrogenase expression/formation protein HypE
MRTLIQTTFLGQANTPAAHAGDDGAAIPWGERWLVVSADAHVVHPLEFPGGDIGRLAVCGTVNDLAMMGACDVLALTLTVVIEEGFSLARLAQLQASIDQACREAQAAVLAGDTKVMRRGELDGIVYSTSGVGIAERVVRDSGIHAGDLLIVSGSIGDHGLAVLAARHDLGLSGALRSDVAPLNGLVRQALAAAGPALHAMKDPTRGGVTSALTELAEASALTLEIDEAALPISSAARAAAELLGVDPLAVANEGKALFAVAPEAASATLAALRAHPLGREAALIGRAIAGAAGTVLLDTGFGKRRLIERDADPLPRIC